MSYPGRSSPVPGAVVPTTGTRRWGDYRPGHETWNPLHAGVDLVAPVGTSVLAPEAGSVVAVGTRPAPPWTGYAPCVFMLGASGRYHLLAHLSGGPLLVAVGQPVQLGQALGTIGAAERHTHWEVRTLAHRGGHEPAIEHSLSPGDWLEGRDVPFRSGPLTAGRARPQRLRTRLRHLLVLAPSMVTARASLCS